MENLRANLISVPDLVETGVDSEYEEMVLKNPTTSPSLCPTCVTVIPVSHSGLVNGTTQGPQSPGEHSYENIPFHKVTISVPDSGGGSRHPPERRNNVPLKYRGIKRVKNKTQTQTKPDTRMFDKCGYSRREVWNWLQPEKGEIEDSVNNNRPASQGVVSVEFSTAEFLAATGRLAHLDLDRFDQFVGNTIDRAVTKSRVKSSDISLLNTAVKKKGREEETNVYVSQEEVVGGCQTCLKAGHSSCSSALSSLESDRSSYRKVVKSGESDSSAIGSMNSDKAVMRPAMNENYMRMSGVKISRGRTRNSLPQLSANKPYQTLEVGGRGESDLLNNLILSQ